LRLESLWLGSVHDGNHVVLASNHVEILHRYASGLESFSGGVRFRYFEVAQFGEGPFSLAGGRGRAPKVLLSHEELALLLGGFDLSQTRRREWHRVILPAEKKLA
jgi:hypothetical protein